MKKIHLAKHLGIASLCLATAVSAFSGIASVDNNVALAEGNIQTTDFVYTTASVTQETRDVHIKKAPKTASDIVKDQSCLNISSDEPYSAMFKNVFTGNTEFRFAFPDMDVTGDFRFRIADVTDQNNYFDIVYYAYSAKGTAICIEWNGQTRMTDGTNSTAAGGAAAAWYNSRQTSSTSSAFRFAPNFVSTATADYYTREGKLQLKWSGDILSIFANGVNRQDGSDSITTKITSFDGTYNADAAKKGFVSKSSWGLPKMNFANGYTVTVSSSVDSTATEDKGTDVSFWKITNNGTTYTFGNETIAKNDNMQAFENYFVALTEADIPQLAVGQVFLGWKNTKTNKLYPVRSMMQKNQCEAVVIDFDTINGASVRIGERSGIRFQTLFDAEQYEAIIKGDYIQSFGMIIAYTDTLTTVGKEFTIENYQDQETFAKVENTKGTFDYTDRNNKTYKAYSMALVEIADYTKAYSARGYLVVKYSTGETKTLYTDYNATDNSRSIAEVAYRLQTIGEEEYNAMSGTQKAIIDNYAAAYVVA